MNIIILGDKFKKGMKSRGCVGLFKINNKQNILQKQYQQAKMHNQNNNFIYIGGFDSKKLAGFLYKHQDLYKNIIYLYNNLYDKTNHGFSISLAQNFLNDECLILDGSLVITYELMEIIKNNGSCIAIGNTDNHIGCIINNSVVDSLGIDLDNKVYNMVYLSKKSAIKLAELISNNKYNNYFMFELINLLIDGGEKFSYIKIKKSQLCYQ